MSGIHESSSEYIYERLKNRRRSSLERVIHIHIRPTLAHVPLEKLVNLEVRCGWAMEGRRGKGIRKQYCTQDRRRRNTLKEKKPLRQAMVFEGQ